jgi:MFS family permease
MIPSSLCPVSIGKLSSVSTSTHASTAIFLTVPYGALSDRTSRRLVVILACVGIVIADALTKIIVAFPNVFPLRLIWATPIFLVIGGGGGVAGSLVYAILADVFPAAER